jgi:SpoVK/Ycf46/Vps4 family AAA+-type ATPase
LEPRGGVPAQIPKEDIRHAARQRIKDKPFSSPLNVDGTLRVDELAKISEGYSASDIKDICQSVQLHVVNELFESGRAMDDGTNPRPIGMSDFREILRIRKPSVSVDMIRAYMRWSDQFKAL